MKKQLKYLTLYISITLLMTSCSQKANNSVGDIAYVATLGIIAVVTAPVSIPLMTGRYFIEKKTINNKYKDVNSTEQILAIHDGKRPNIIHNYEELYIWEYNNLRIQDDFDVTIEYNIYFLIKESDVLSYSDDIEDIQDWEKITSSTLPKPEPPTLGKQTPIWE